MDQIMADASGGADMGTGAGAAAAVGGGMSFLAGASIGLAAIQLIGGYQQSQITMENGQLQNKIAQMNQRFANYNAAQELQKGQSDSAKYAEVVNQTEAADKSAEAGTGVSVNYGTASDLSASNKIAGMSNVLQIQRQAQNQAVGMQTQALNIGLSGQQALTQAGMTSSSELTAGIEGAASTGISYMNFQNSTGKGNSARTGSSSYPGGQDAYYSMNTARPYQVGYGAPYANPSMNYSGSTDPSFESETA